MEKQGLDQRFLGNTLKKKGLILHDSRWRHFYVLIYEAWRWKKNLLNPKNPQTFYKFTVSKNTWNIFSFIFIFKYRNHIINYFEHTIWKLRNKQN